MVEIPTGHTGFHTTSIGTVVVPRKYRPPTRASWVFTAGPISDETRDAIKVALRMVVRQHLEAHPINREQSRVYRRFNRALDQNMFPAAAWAARRIGVDPDTLDAIAALFG